MLFKHGLVGLAGAGVGGASPPYLFIGLSTTEGESANPWSKSFSVTNSKTYLIIVMSTLAQNTSSVSLGAVSATKANAGGENGETTSGTATVSGWYATANTTGSVSISVTQSTGGTKDVGIALYDVTGLSLIDDDGDSDFSNPGDTVSIARSFGSAGGTGIPVFSGTVFNSISGNLTPTALSIDAEHSLTSSRFVAASEEDSIVGADSYEIINDVGLITGAMHTFWYQ